MSPGSGDRIVVDPDDLRRAAVRMRGAALLLSGTGRELGARPLPGMPAGVRGKVTETLRRANAELQDLASELMDEAALLGARARWADLGGDVIGWLLPGFHRLSPAGMAGEGPAALLSPATSEQLEARSEWTGQVLEGLRPHVESDSTAADPFAGMIAEANADELDEASERALGRLTLAGGMALDDVDAWGQGWAAEETQAVTAEGLDEAGLGPTLTGILACMVAGSGSEAAGEGPAR